MNDNIMLELRHVTGWSKEKIELEFSNLICSVYQAKNAFLATGRVPTISEQEFIKECGFDLWYSAVRLNIIN